MEGTREELERVVTALANKIRIQGCYKFKESEFVIILSDELINSALIRAGNPVIITIRSSELVNAIKTKDTRDFVGLLERCVGVIPRMLHSLSLVPIADVLAHNDEIKKWKRLTIAQAERYVPRMLPTNEVYFDVQTVVTAYHTRTDTTVRIKGHGSLEALKQEAHMELSKMVRDNITNPIE